jgi:hypothetical protein
MKRSCSGLTGTIQKEFIDDHEELLITPMSSIAS